MQRKRYNMQVSSRITINTAAINQLTTLAQSAVKLVMGVIEQGEEVTRATT